MDSSAKRAKADASFRDIFVNTFLRLQTARSGRANFTHTSSADGGSDGELSGVFGCDDSLDAAMNAMFWCFEPHILQFLVIDLRLSQQNSPSV